MSERGPDRPALVLVRGEPTPEEVAALLAVLTARAAAPPTAAPVPSAWCQRSRLVRSPHRHGPGAWRASALPR